jgi:protein-disulfide isomerase/uncharacterized membrane protein
MLPYCPCDPDRLVVMPRHLTSQPAVAPGLRTLGILALIVACGAALMLALDHFDLARAPGCGPQSGCDQAARSAWGSVPGLGYPTSLVGTAWFAAALAGWLACSRGVPSLFRALMWLGGALSIVFIAAMLAGGYLCKYCIAAHAANLVFIGVMELAARRAGSAAGAMRVTSRAPALVGVFTFMLATIALAGTHVLTESRREARDAALRDASVKQLLQSTSRPGDDRVNVLSTTAADTQPQSDGPPFTGRWLLGPKDAPIRIVMLTDYQCPDCRYMEAAAMSIVESRNDVSLSVKHFPMSNKCNRHINVDMHANACWAARAAEAAGQLYGNDGFWKMHRWLFSVKGEFTDATFPAALAQLGFDPQRLIARMQSQDTLTPVQADIEEGVDLGLFITPLIFINGIELRGFVGNAGALASAVNQLAATNPPPASPARDQPPRAARKYVEDWARDTRREIPPLPTPHRLGPDNARVQIVVWGDLQEPLTRELDQLIRARLSADADIRYEYRHFPFDQSCNPFVPRTVYPSSCMAARAAEAAGMLGGNDAFWKMQQWLLANQKPLTNDALMQGAMAAGVQGEALLAQMNDTALQTALRQSIQQAQPFIRQGVPTLMMNGRWAPRWKLEGADILADIIAQAKRE